MKIDLDKFVKVWIHIFLLFSIDVFTRLFFRFINLLYLALFCGISCLGIFYLIYNKYWTDYPILVKYAERFNFWKELLRLYLNSKIISMSISEDENRSTISYIDLGKDYKIVLPYNRRLKLKMIKYSVYLILDDKEKNEKIEITQQPGIPYMFSAKMLGGKKIKIYNSEGNLVKEYEEDEIPNIMNLKID